MNIREQVEMKLKGRREKNAHDSIQKKNEVLSKYPDILKLESDARDLSLIHISEPTRPY